MGHFPDLPTAMQQPILQDSALFGTGSTLSTQDRHDARHGDHRAAARALYNLPSPSEKLTDSTLPITWPTPFLEQLKTEELSAPDAAPLMEQPAPHDATREDYAQLMLKLQAESIVARQGAQVDKALYAAHYVSTLIAALAFAAMMGVVLLTSFPSLLSL